MTCEVKIDRQGQRKRGPTACSTTAVPGFCPYHVHTVPRNFACGSSQHRGKRMSQLGERSHGSLPSVRLDFLDSLSIRWWARIIALLPGLPSLTAKGYPTRPASREKLACNDPRPPPSIPSEE